MTDPERGTVAEMANELLQLADKEETSVLGRRTRTWMLISAGTGSLVREGATGCALSCVAAVEITVVVPASSFQTQIIVKIVVCCMDTHAH